ncbi:hypothetical protein AJ78_08087 [Emergomyces pasteurianus Ep9510]|uniref:Uncharacterized protein n=1 Tax=Emergomyces pasteurianus Ep9510 TaxID=1447872 RepID=A0A1J9Q564_9EURO|nr:hypothetical protein AJ78_08087 [Emergomyces pasteurianus Ep9510]
MEVNAIESLYRGINKASIENAVDALWLNILRMYFQPKDGFVLHTQIPLSTRAAGNIGIVRVDDTGNQEIVILCESKRAAFESQNTQWELAVDQLESYLKIVRGGFGLKQRTLYGIVAVGRYCRFYQLGESPGEELEALPLTNEKVLHIKKDEAEIHNPLKELFKKTNIF